MNSGVYKITNLINGKIYIGSAVNLNRRCYQHFYHLKNNNHHSNYLQKAFNKYGIENFIFETILKCSKEYLLIIEQYLIDYYKPQYNICKIAGNLSGFKHKDSMKNFHRERMLNNDICIGRTLSKEHKDKIGDANRNKVRSLETIEKLRKAKVGKKQSQETIQKRVSKTKGKKFTQEQKLKASQRSSSKKSVYQICPKTGNILNEYESITKAANSIGVCSDAIGNAVRGVSNFSGGFIWKLKTDYNANNK